uniref:Transposase-associated domain-containing protein n=1 Tax=Setaria italica TaxID=4555 RepID=K3XSV5_SETIT
MDQRAWMYGIWRHSPTFMSEVAKFEEPAKKHARICKTKQIYCPCFDCSNKIVWEDTNVIKRHLIKQGFVDGYTIWSHHGEAGGTSNNTNINTGCDEVGGDDANDDGDHVMMDDDYNRGDQNGDQTDVRGEPQVDEERDVDMEDMLRHIEPKLLLGSAKGLENFETLKKAAKDRNLLPKLNFVPKNTYEANKIINPLKMRVQRIHACRNNCVSYRGEYATLEKCPNCDASHYKSNADFCEDRAGSSIRNKSKKGAKKSISDKVEDESYIGTDTMTQRRVPSLVMWYLPVVDRLERLFANPKTVEMMTWHANRPVKDDGKV